MDGSMGGDKECDGFRRKLIFVLLLLADIEIDGDAGGGIALLRDRFGEGYETVSETTEWVMGEYGKRSWLATADKASNPWDSASLALEPLLHGALRAWASATALDSAISRSSA
jgi:hypothetical protein